MSHWPLSLTLSHSCVGILKQMQTYTRISWCRVAQMILGDTHKNISNSLATNIQTYLTVSTHCKQVVESSQYTCTLLFWCDLAHRRLPSYNTAAGFFAKLSYVISGACTIYCSTRITLTKYVTTCSWKQNAFTLNIYWNTMALFLFTKIDDLFVMLSFQIGPI